MDRYTKFRNRHLKRSGDITDEKVIEYLYGNGYVDLKIADYVTKRINGIVRHGKWKKPLFSKGIMACSACGYYFQESQMAHRRYCPNCGARMDGDT